MEFLNLGLAFMAGLVSILSPCVLPLLPVVLGTVVSEHRFGSMALAAGLGLSFLGLGLFASTVGWAMGWDGEFFRQVGAVLLMLFGAVLLLPAAQSWLSWATAPVGIWAEPYVAGGKKDSLWGQFSVGILLGAVWTPCVGPTLGAASLLAAQGTDLGQVALTMVLFALGTTVALLSVGLLSREALKRWRGKLLTTGRAGKFALGGVLLLTGLLIVTGMERTVESALVSVLPDWMMALSSKF